MSSVATSAAVNAPVSAVFPAHGLAPVDRVDVFHSRGVYTAEVLLVGAKASDPVMSQAARPKTWRTLDSLAAFIAKTYGDANSFIVHFGVKTQ